MYIQIQQNRAFSQYCWPASNTLLCLIDGSNWSGSGRDPTTRWCELHITMCSHCELGRTATTTIRHGAVLSSQRPCPSHTFLPHDLYLSLCHPASKNKGSLLGKCWTKNIFLLNYWSNREPRSNVCWALAPIDLYLRILCTISTYK